MAFLRLKHAIKIVKNMQKLSKYAKNYAKIVKICKKIMQKLSKHAKKNAKNFNFIAIFGVIFDKFRYHKMDFLKCFSLIKYF